MPIPKILDLARNIEKIAACNACGLDCYEIDQSKEGPECITWSKPSMLLDLRVGRGSHATIIKLCDACLAELGWKITGAISVPEARK